jgi:FkbM family methyltransferase
MAHIARALAKIGRILRSDLAGMDRIWFLLHEALERIGLQATGVRSYTLRDGARVSLRAGSTDAKVFEEVFIDHIYAPFAHAARHLKPTVLVDLGANIGLSSLYLEKQLGFDHIIAVEPEFDNLRSLRRNLDGNLGAPCESIQAFAGAERGFAHLLDAGFGAWGLRMGQSAEEGIPVLPLEEIVPTVPGGVLLKCDIEGAEQHLFPRIAQWDHLVSFVILELHTEFFSYLQLQATLNQSSYEWRVVGSVDPRALLSVFALERGAQKPKAVNLELDSRNHSRGAAAM